MNRTRETARRFSYSKIVGSVAGIIIAIGFSAGQDWRIRAGAIWSFFLVSLLLLVPLILSQDFSFVPETSKIVKVYHSRRVRLIVEIVFRVGCAGLVWFVAHQFWLVSLDLVDVNRVGGPKQLVGPVVDLHYSGLTLGIDKTVVLHTAEQCNGVYRPNCDFTAWFYGGRIRVGAEYEIWLLSRTGAILSMQPIR